LRLYAATRLGPVRQVLSTRQGKGDGLPNTFSKLLPLRILYASSTVPQAATLAMHFTETDFFSEFNTLKSSVEAASISMTTFHPRQMFRLAAFLDFIHHPEF
jgi:hypothetical protein